MIDQDDVEIKAAIYQEPTSQTAAAITRAYRSGLRELNHRIDKILRAAQYLGDFSTKEEARAWLSMPANEKVMAELREYAETLKEPERSIIIKRTQLGAYKFRLSRQEALQAALTTGQARIAEAIVTGTAQPFTNAAYLAYGYGAYELQKQARVAFSLTDIPTRRLNNMLSSRFEFTRAQRYAKGFVDKAAIEVFNSILIGEPLANVTETLSEVSKTAPWRAKALARTMITEISNESENIAYKEAGVKRYMYRATLDERTCPICGKLDGQTFDMAKARKGENLPPMHVNCRCVHTAVLSQRTVNKLYRSGRDENGRSVRFKADMTYNEWAQEYLPKINAREQAARAQARARRKK